MWFFWLMVGEILDIWLPRWAAFVIVFGAMLLMAAGLVVLGIRRMKKIKKPELTLQEASATADALKKAAARCRSRSGGRGERQRDSAATKARNGASSTAR